MSRLTRSITDRLFVGFFSAVFAPLAGLLLYAQLTHSSPAAGEDWLVHLFFFFVFECVTVIFLGSILGLVWAVWTPDWIERRLKHSVSHFVVMLCAVGIVIAIGALLYAFVQKP